MGVCDAPAAPATWGVSGPSGRVTSGVFYGAFTSHSTAHVRTRYTVLSSFMEAGARCGFRRRRQRNGALPSCVVMAVRSGWRHRLEGGWGGGPHLLLGGRYAGNPRPPEMGSLDCKPYQFKKLSEVIYVTK